MTQPTGRSSELSAYLSHELRNALACIQQFGSILVDGLAGELSGEQREYLGIIMENATKIRRVLDSALDGTGRMHAARPGDAPISRRGCRSMFSDPALSRSFPSWSWPFDGLRKGAPSARPGCTFS